MPGRTSIPRGPAIVLGLTSTVTVGAIVWSHYSQVRDRSLMREGVERDKLRMKLKRQAERERRNREKMDDIQRWSSDRDSLQSFLLQRRRTLKWFWAIDKRLSSLGFKVRPSREVEWIVPSTMTIDNSIKAKTDELQVLSSASFRISTTYVVATSASFVARSGGKTHCCIILWLRWEIYATAHSPGRARWKMDTSGTQILGAPDWEFF